MNRLRVHVDIDGRPVPAGIAYFTVTRARVSTSFVYDEGYLAHPRAVDVEPGLPRVTGAQYVDGLPGSFADCSPDRWGRNLVDKRRRARQREAVQRLPAATAVDYLVGVGDLTRQGDLRFTGVDGGPFLDPDHVVPKLVSLPRLLSAADRVDRGDDLAAVKELLDAGSGSLGGARPKASVRDDGRLLIVKFPHAHDRWDVASWEKTALDLAERAGVRAPGRRLVAVGERNVLALDRFDRGPGLTRVGYISAMTLLGRIDGDEGDYLDIAEAIPEHGARVAEDLVELFRRAVLNVAIHNTDDHLRNHGFLRARGGWALSPVFDVNPEPDPGKGRVTSIAGSTEDTAEGLLALAAACRLPERGVRAVVSAVRDSVRSWRAVATGNGIAERGQAGFADAIEHGLSVVGRLAH